jgi:2-(1,2-epoxy-1,2-dihydrophenyl)acetyl-CoA isomerase
MSGGIRLEIADGVAVLTLDRPDHGNSLDIPTAHLFVHLLQQVADDPSVRCLLLRAEGRMFSVGGDVTGFAAAGDRVADHIRELAGTMHDAMQLLAGMPKPVVTLVHGPAAGAGLSLALVGDVVLASPASHFTAAYTALGVTPDCGLTWILPRLVGARLASEMILTNRRISADEAERVRLITRISSDLETEGRTLAKALADGATAALGAARQLLHASWSADFTAQLDVELNSIATTAEGREGREGIAAFVARRPPEFRED